jgi:hypothetical protein
MEPQFDFYRALGSVKRVPKSFLCGSGTILPRDETKVYRRHYQSRRPEKDMTLEHIAMIIAAHIIVLIILWAPLLDFIGPPCVRFLQRRREQKASNKATFAVGLPNALPE